jgi:hypothetical protein
MRIPAVRKRRGAGHSVNDAFTDKRNSLTKQGYLESDDDFFANNRFAAVWFLENRDRLSEVVTGKKLTRTVGLPKNLFDEVINLLARSSCKFFACRGPAYRVESQVTCIRCYTLRKLLLFAKKEGIRSEHFDMLEKRSEK